MNLKSIAQQVQELKEYVRSSERHLAKVKKQIEQLEAMGRRANPKKRKPSN
jgi:hypothetical protein